MQIPQQDRVRSYELTYLIAGSVASDKVAKIHAGVTQLLEKHGCTQLKQDDWGKRPMAYPIKYQGKKETEAVYTHVTFDAVTNIIPKLDTDLRLSQHSMRYLIVLAEKEVPSSETALQVEEMNSSEDASSVMLDAKEA